MGTVSFDPVSPVEVQRRTVEPVVSGFWSKVTEQERVQELAPPPSHSIYTAPDAPAPPAPLLSRFEPPPPAPYPSPPFPGLLCPSPPLVGKPLTTRPPPPPPPQ